LVSHDALERVGGRGERINAARSNALLAVVGEEEPGEMHSGKRLPLDVAAKAPAERPERIGGTVVSEQEAGVVALAAVLQRKPLILELGCGPAKRNPLAVGVDVLDFPGVDLLGDAIEVLRSFPPGSVDAIYSEHFMEHLLDPRELLELAARALRPGGTFRAIVPHFSNPYFYSDPTHKTFFGLYTFGYWVENTPFRRQVPQYETPISLDLVQVTYSFKSSRPFYVRHLIKKVLSFWVNSNRWTKEFYEEVLTGVMPSYELEYTLVKQ
jgi:SAM-dependent methyltransferase